MAGREEKKCRGAGPDWNPERERPGRLVRFLGDVPKPCTWNPSAGSTGCDGHDFEGGSARLPAEHDRPPADPGGSSRCQGASRVRSQSWRQ